MPALVCDMCAGKLVVMPDGSVECESCGLKYDKKTIQDKVQQINATVKLDHTDEIENYIELANSAMISSNYDEALLYANKALEVNSDIPQAWYIKAQLSCMDSVEHYANSLTLFDNAYKYALDDDKETLLDNIQTLLTKYAFLYLDNSASVVKGSYTDKSLALFKNAYQSILKGYDNYLNNVSDEDGVLGDIVGVVKKEVIDKLEVVTDDLIKDALSMYKRMRFSDDKRVNKLFALGAVGEIQLAYDCVIEYYADSIYKVIEVANKQFNSLCKIRPSLDVEINTLRNKYLEKPKNTLVKYNAKKKALCKAKVEPADSAKSKKKRSRNPVQILYDSARNRGEEKPSKFRYHLGQVVIWLLFAFNITLTSVTIGLIQDGSFGFIESIFMAVILVGLFWILSMFHDLSRLGFGKKPWFNKDR